MKARGIFIGLIICTVALAGQQGIKVERKYVAGEVDVYRLRVKMDTVMGDVVVTMDQKETVKKVYENGDADIETAVTDMVAVIGGQEQKLPTRKPEVERFDKNGSPVTASSKDMNFVRFGSVLGDRELKVGETYSFERPEKDNPKNYVKGSVKLASLEGSVAKLELVVDSFSASSPKPLHLEGSSWVDTSKGKVVKFEGVATNLPDMGGSQGPGPQKIEFLRELKK